VINENMLRDLLKLGTASNAKVVDADDYKRFEELYRAETAKPGRYESLVDASDASELGVAAYALGVHYIEQDRPDLGERWMRVAAEHDISDSAFRLAGLHEIKAVEKFNSCLGEDNSEDNGDDEFSEAHYWYRVAASKGYAVRDYPDRHDLEVPIYSLDCCDRVRLAAELERAKLAIAEAREEAEKIRLDARENVNTIIAQAGGEVNRLAVQRKRLAAEVAVYEETLDTVRRIVRGRGASIIRLIGLSILKRLSGQSRMRLRQLAAVYEMTINASQAMDMEAAHETDRLQDKAQGLRVIKDLAEMSSSSAKPLDEKGTAAATAEPDCDSAHDTELVRS
jgi:hypothetical protein